MLAQNRGGTVRAPGVSRGGLKTATIGSRAPKPNTTVPAVRKPIGMQKQTPKPLPQKIGGAQTLRQAVQNKGPERILHRNANGTIKMQELPKPAAYLERDANGTLQMKQVPANQLRKALPVQRGANGVITMKQQPQVNPRMMQQQGQSNVMQRQGQAKAQMKSLSQLRAQLQRLPGQGGQQQNSVQNRRVASVIGGGNQQTGGLRQIPRAQSAQPQLRLGGQGGRISQPLSSPGNNRGGLITAPIMGRGGATQTMMAQPTQMMHKQPVKLPQSRMMVGSQSARGSLVTRSIADHGNVEAGSIIGGQGAVQRSASMGARPTARAADLPKRLGVATRMIPQNQPNTQRAKFATRSIADAGVSNARNTNQPIQAPPTIQAPAMIHGAPLKSIQAPISAPRKQTGTIRAADMGVPKVQRVGTTTIAGKRGGGTIKAPATKRARMSSDNPFA